MIRVFVLYNIMDIILSNSFISFIFFYLLQSPPPIIISQCSSSLLLLSIFFYSLYLFYSLPYYNSTIHPIIHPLFKTKQNEVTILFPLFSLLSSLFSLLSSLFSLLSLKSILFNTQIPILYIQYIFTTLSLLSILYMFIYLFFQKVRI